MKPPMSPIERELRRIHYRELFFNLFLPVGLTLIFLIAYGWIFYYRFGVDAIAPAFAALMPFAWLMMVISARRKKR